MSHTPTVCRNTNGGWYECGAAYSQAKWLSVLHKYKTLLKKHGTCSICCLAKEACVGLNLAHRAVKLYREGLTVMPKRQRGHGRRGIGSAKMLTVEHHTFIYEPYKKKNIIAFVWVLQRVFQRVSH